MKAEITKKSRFFGKQAKKQTFRLKKTSPGDTLLKNRFYINNHII